MHLAHSSTCTVWKLSLLKTVSHCRMHTQLTPSELGGGPTANDYCSAALEAELIEINGAIAIDVKALQRLLRDMLTHGTFCSP